MIISKKALIPLFIGLSLCGISSILYYLLIKKKSDEDDVKQTKSSFQIKEITILKSQAPLLIGRGGSNIKSIKEKSGCKINFKDENPNEEMRVCELRGTPDQVEKAHLLIQEFIIEISNIKEESVYVPQSTISRIIGRHGESINKIKNISNAIVRVTDNKNSNGVEVVIKGVPTQIECAKKLIEQKVAEVIELRESLAKREPRGKRDSQSPRKSPSSDSEKSSSSEIILQNEKLTDKVVVQTADGLIEVYVSAMIDPGKFWVQIVGPKAKELDQLADKMTEFYQNEENRSLFKINKISPGRIVAAFFTIDKRCYRAEILKVLDKDNEVEIYFVDYGDIDIVSRDDIFELSAEFLKLRYQAIECFLANIEPKDGKTWSEEASDLFENLAHVARWKKLTSKIVCFKDKSSSYPLRNKREGSPIPGVELYDHTPSGDINLAEELVKQGFANFNTKPQSPKVQISSPSANDTFNKPTISSTPIHENLKPEHVSIESTNSTKSDITLKPINLSDKSDQNSSDRVKNDEDNLNDKSNKPVTIKSKESTTKKTEQKRNSPSADSNLKFDGTKQTSTSLPKQTVADRLSTSFNNNMKKSNDQISISESVKSGATSVGDSFKTAKSDNSMNESSTNNSDTLYDSCDSLSSSSTLTSKDSLNASLSSINGSSLNNDSFGSNDFSKSFIANERNHSKK